MSLTIVVPLPGPWRDPERAGEEVLPVARALARRTQAAVILLSVLEVLPDFGDLPVDALDQPEVVERRVAERQEYLAEVASTFPGQRVQIIVKLGDPTQEILALSDLLDQSIIALASHGRSGIDRLALGSIAIQLVRRATCPVLVVPALASDQVAAEPLLLERILVPLDGSPFAEHAVDSALAALGPAELHVHLVLVLQRPGRRDGPAAHTNAVVKHRDAEHYLANVAERLVLRGHRATWELRVGPPAGEIARAAQEHQVDMIAMSTHGRSGVGRLLRPSVAEGIVQRRVVPLLLVRPSAAAVARSLRAARAGHGVGPPVTAGQKAPVQTLHAVDIMTAPVVTVREEATLEEVAQLMLAHRIGCVPVVDEQGRLQGLITESDFTGRERGLPFSAYRVPQLFGQWLSHEGIEQVYATGRRLTARQIMRTPVITAREDSPVTSVAEQLVRHDITRIPIVRDGIPVGIVARRDLLKLLVPDERAG